MTAKNVIELANELRREAMRILRLSEGDTYATEMLRAAEYLAAHGGPGDPSADRVREAIGVLVVRDMRTAGLPPTYDRMMQLAIQLAAID